MSITPENMIPHTEIASYHGIGSVIMFNRTGMKDGRSLDKLDGLEPDSLSVFYEFLGTVLGCILN